MHTQYIVVLWFLLQWQHGWWHLNSIKLLLQPRRGTRALGQAKVLQILRQIYCFNKRRPCMWLLQTRCDVIVACVSVHARSVVAVAARNIRLSLHCHRDVHCHLHTQVSIGWSKSRLKLVWRQTTIVQPKSFFKLRQALDCRHGTHSWD